MSKLKVLDLFSGIGGFSLGLERTGGFETVAFCEIEEFPRKVLRKHWPEVPIFEDVINADFGHIGPVDLVTAGFPCQDISLAGKGAGLAGSRSGLFWHILRTAGVVGRPKLLLENVAALLDRGMGAVLGALAQIGYDAEWHCIPASAVGAPHRRDRLWVMADAYASQSSKRGECSHIPTQGVGRRNDIKGRNVPLGWEKSVRKARGNPANPHTDSDSGEGQQPSSVDAQEWPQPLSGQIGSLLASHGRRWPTESGFYRVANGVPDQSHRIKALGNAVVPQIPEIIGQAILAAERGE